MAVALTPGDEALLAGERGDAAAFAMRLLLRFAEAVDASALLDIEAAHIDGCLHLGRASLDFVERLVALEGKVRVPTTLNVGSVDLIHPELFRGSPEAARDGARLMQAHLELGGLPSFTCAPYQTARRPRFGAQIAWGESNAIVFANSVIGARTERYGDFIDLCCALTGRAPAFGLHLDANRRATALVEIEAPRGWSARLIAIAVGHRIGRSGVGVPAITGLPASTGEDDLKALGATAASSGALAMFHAIGLTPEARTLEQAFQGRAPERTLRFDARDLAEAIGALSTAPDGAPLAAVALGTPHFSSAEFAALFALLDGERPKIGLWVNTSRETLAELAARGLEAPLRAAGVTLVVDTCTYVTPILPATAGAIMTDSGKCAYYMPGNLGVQIAFGSLAECVASARAGRVTRL